MRVLFGVDEAHEGMPGGHRVQVDHTVAGVRKLGVDARVGIVTGDALRGVDVLHSVGASLEQFRLARQMRVPIAASTIYWSQEYVLGGLPGAGSVAQAKRRARQIASTFRHGTIGAAHRFMQPVLTKQLLFEAADLLLPNSQLEAGTIRHELGVSTPMHVVPNGVDHHAFVLPEPPSARRGVLYAGRVEPHKNQLGLIHALAGTGISLTIAGASHPEHGAYVDACKKAAGPDVTFVPPRDHAGLVELYQQAAVHVMPSWFETTGLSSLEAAMCGAAVVTTNAGYAREYFRDMAEYCDPSEPATIRTAVERALSTGPHAGLREHILGNFTWDHAAAATVAGYERLVATVMA